MGMFSMFTKWMIFQVTMIMIADLFDLPAI